MGNSLSDKGFLPLIGGLPTVLVILVIVVAALIFGPTIAMFISPELKLLFQIFAAIIILNWVRNTVGPGTLSLIISCILIFIFVIMLPEFTSMLWMTYIILSFGLWSMIFWGLPLIFGKKR